MKLESDSNRKDEDASKEETLEKNFHKKLLVNSTTLKMQRIKCGGQFILRKIEKNVSTLQKDDCPIKRHRMRWW